MMNQQELMQLLSDKERLSSLTTLTQDQLREMLGDRMARMHGYDQRNPHHHLDLWQHTVAVVLGLDDSLLSLRDTQTLRLAALLHDVGKPDVATMKAGRQVFYGHPDKSAEIAGELLAAWGFPAEEIGRVCFLVASHDSFISFKLPQELSPMSNRSLIPITPETVLRQVRRIRNRSAHGLGYVPQGNDYALLMRLMAADSAAQAGTTFLGGRLSDTRESKLWRVRTIADALTCPPDELP